MRWVACRAFDAVATPDRWNFVRKRKDPKPLPNASRSVMRKNSFSSVHSGPPKTLVAVAIYAKTGRDFAAAVLSQNFGYDNRNKSNFRPPGLTPTAAKLF